MNVPFGAAAPTSGFSFFGGQQPLHHSDSNQTNDIVKTANKKVTGSSRHSDKPSKKHTKGKANNFDGKTNVDKGTGPRKPRLARISGIENSRIGSLVANPQQFGFRRIPHKRRPVPRFLINQQSQLKRKEFVQDSWDAANQKKMLQLESNIDDFSELYETLRKMRDVERKMMESKHLVDKADSAKDLTEAINFQGTCQDMCPVFERARRNVEYTVYSYEKNDPEDKKAARDKALKVFSRPAAAAAPPLPSDVRPPHTLVKTLDYIVDNLLTTLPQSEGFLWDRMRSIRQDFTYQNYSGPEAVDCNERIVRIHLLVVHLMAQNKAEYSLQQELEQLHKSLITLSEIYDEVRASGGSCPNEAEFRAYASLSKIRDPEYDKALEKLPSHIFQNDLVQQAVCFRRLISNSNYVKRGVIRTENCLNFYQRFFQLIATEKVPFLMCSFLELYVNEVRFYAFKALSYSLNKKHKPIPTQYFLENFLFNDETELIEFCKYYSIEVSPDGVELKTLTHTSHKLPERQPLRQPYLKCVDNMLQGSTFNFIVNSGKSNIDTIPDQRVFEHISNTDVESTSTDDRRYTSEHETDRAEADTEMESAMEVGKDTEFEKGAEESLKFNQAPHKMLQAQKPSIPPSRFMPYNMGSIGLIKPQSTQTAGETEPNARNGTFMPPGLFPKTNDRLVYDKHLSKNIKSNNTIAIGSKAHLGENQAIINNLEVEKESQRRFSKQSQPVLTHNNLRKIEAASALANQVVKEVVHKRTVAIVENSLQKGRQRQARIDNLADVLYHAFIHEKLYLIYMDSKADAHYRNKLKSKLFRKWSSRYLEKTRKKESDQRKREDIQKVERQLGVPILKNTFSRTPKSHDLANNSFCLSSSRKKDVIFSPVNNEVNKFDVQASKQTEVWECLPMKDLYFKKISDKFSSSEAPYTADVFIYGKDWESVCGSWMINKFALSSNEKSYKISDGHLTMNLCCIDRYYDPSKFTSVQLLVFNTGVTDASIFDLELKLQQDGEELIKLITGISLNSDICFSLLVVYWESAENPLAPDVVSKCLKLNRIAKSFSGVLEQIGIVNINSYMPHKALENGLVDIANQYKPRLTDRGRYNRHLREKRSTSGGSHLLTTKAIDERMKRMHDSEEKKLRKTHDERNTYAHLQSHIAASPKLKKRKLPVLLSKNRENRFETPQTKRTASSSSSAMFSHLALKLGKSTRFSSINLAPATPSHSTNFPPALTDSHNTPQLSNEQSALQEPSLFQTPRNFSSTVVNQPARNRGTQDSSPAGSPQAPKNVPNNVMELKNLIESVRYKINGNPMP